VDELDDPATTMDTLWDSRGMDSMDTQLLAEVVRITANTLIGGEVLRAQTRAKDTRRHFTGRQALLLVYQHFRTEESNSHHLSYLDIMSVIFKGDDRMHTFIENWDNVLVRIRDEVPNHALELFLCSN